MSCRRLLKMSYQKRYCRCLIEDGLEMPYLKMSYRCLIEDGLQMSYLKMSCRCLVRDVFETIIYLETSLKIKRMSQICLINPFNECILSI